MGLRNCQYNQKNFALIQQNGGMAGCCVESSTEFSGQSRKKPQKNCFEFQISFVFVRKDYLTIRKGRKLQNATNDFQK